MNPDEDRRLSRQFNRAVTASDIEEVRLPDVQVSRPSSPPSFMEDRDEQAVRNVADPVCLKAMFLAAVIDKDQDQDGEVFCTQVLELAS